MFIILSSLIDIASAPDTFKAFTINIKSSAVILLISSLSVSLNVTSMPSPCTSTFPNCIFTCCNSSSTNFSVSSFDSLFCLYSSILLDVSSYFFSTSSYFDFQFASSVLNSASLIFSIDVISVSLAILNCIDITKASAKHAITIVIVIVILPFFMFFFMFSSYLYFTAFA